MDRLGAIFVLLFFVMGIVGDSRMTCDMAKLKYKREG